MDREGDSSSGDAPSLATHETSRRPPRSPWRRLVRRALLFAAVPYVAIVGLLAAFQRSLIYVPTRESSLAVWQYDLPRAKVEPVMVRAADGLTLNGWLFRSQKETVPMITDPSRASRRPLVLYFCGNAGHRGFRMPEFELLTEGGADVLCCDYRGYGDNAGRPSEAALASDALAVWRFAVDSLGVAPDRIVLFGESLGGGVATRLAADVCDAGTPPGGLVLRSTFSSLTDVAAEAVPWVPVRLVLQDRYPSEDRIRAVTCPVLMLHGARDTIVPLRFGKSLFDAAPAASNDDVPKRFVELPAADHNDVLERDCPRVRAALQEFLSERSGRG